MQGFVTFIFSTLLILSAFFVFIVILIGGWIVGTVYLWIDGAVDERPAKLTWWNRSNRQ